MTALIMASLMAFIGACVFRSVVLWFDVRADRRYREEMAEIHRRLFDPDNRREWPS